MLKIQLVMPSKFVEIVQDLHHLLMVQVWLSAGLKPLIQFGMLLSLEKFQEFKIWKLKFMLEGQFLVLLEQQLVSKDIKVAFIAKAQKIWNWIMKFLLLDGEVIVKEIIGLEEIVGELSGVKWDISELLWDKVTWIWELNKIAVGLCLLMEIMLAMFQFEMCEWVWVIIYIQYI